MPARSDGRRRTSLRTKLVAAILAVAAVMFAYLTAWFGPQAEQSFLFRSEVLIGQSAEALRELATTHIRNSEHILADVIQHTTDARARALHDLPLELYGGDADLIREKVLESDRTRAEQLASNVQVLGRELRRRAAARIERHIGRLSDRQREFGKELAADLRGSLLLLSGGMLVLLVVLLGFGLDRFIVRPVHRLRDASRELAGGNLAVEIRRTSRDEVGDLAGAFATMVEKLRASQLEVEQKNAQLERWNDTLRDEVRRTQLELTRADQLAALGTLAGGIAHEFNNLIGGIRGCLEGALEDQPDSANREPLEVALRATGRATTITEKLLRFARPRMKGIEATSVADMVAEVVDLVALEARRQEVEVHVDIPADLMVVVDSGEMHQVFLNLFTNALQAMESGGTLSVEGRRDGDDVVLVVRDTGVGIPEKDLPKIFDPFYRSTQNRPGSSPGTGLGLSVTFGIIEAHGGTLSVHSEVGVGSTFTVRLPSKPEEER